MTLADIGNIILTVLHIIGWLCVGIAAFIAVIFVVNFLYNWANPVGSKKSLNHLRHLPGVKVVDPNTSMIAFLEGEIFTWSFKDKHKAVEFALKHQIKLFALMEMNLEDHVIHGTHEEEYLRDLNRKTFGKVVLC
jgi:hypothetical protein